jgi:hypothetical protein
MMKKLMMKVMRSFVAAACLGPVVGCGTIGFARAGPAAADSPAAAESDRSAEYLYATSDTAFEAAKSAFFDLNVDITSASRENGFLNGRRMVTSRPATAMLPGGTTSTWDSYSCVIVVQPDNSIRIKLRIVRANDDGTVSGEAGHDGYAPFWEHVSKALDQ